MEEPAYQKNPISSEKLKQVDEQIQKAHDNHDVEVVAVMKEVRKMLAEIGGVA